MIQGQLGLIGVTLNRNKQSILEQPASRGFLSYKSVLFGLQNRLPGLFTEHPHPFDFYLHAWESFTLSGGK